MEVPEGPGTDDDSGGAGAEGAGGVKEEGAVVEASGPRARALRVRREHPGLAEVYPELLQAMDPRCSALLPYLLHNLYLQRHLPSLRPPKLV